MSLLGELTYFLGLKVQQNKDNIFFITNKVSQADLEEISDGGFKTSMYPYGNTAKQRFQHVLGWSITLFP